MLKWIHGCICKKNNSNRTIINCTTATAMSIISITSLTACSIPLGFLCMLAKQKVFPLPLWLLRLDKSTEHVTTEKWIQNERKEGQSQLHYEFNSLTAYQFCWNTSHTRLLWHLPTLTAMNIYRFNRCMSHNKGHLPLLPTPSVPMTATLVSPNEDFFRRR